MRTHVLIGLAVLVGLAGVAPPVAAQEVTAEVRTWSGESWRLMQPSFEVFYTILPKGKAVGGSNGMQSPGSSVGISKGQAPMQGHKRKEAVIFFREGAEMQIPLARIKSLQFFRQPVEKSLLPPYVAATHFRYFATAVLVDGSHVEGDYVNLGTMVLRGMTPQGRVDVPWEEIENVRFETEGFPRPTAEERVALASVVTEPPRPAPKAPAPVKRQITPPKKAPDVPQPTAAEQKVARRSAFTEPPVPIPKAPAPVKRDVVFDFNSLLLSDDAKVALNAFGKWLKANPDTTIVMEGHCDERERGTDAYNLALGELRLKAVREYLVTAGINKHRISTATDGQERPVVLGHDLSAWKCNRRVHLEMVQVEGPTR
jgi:peptidoglycan-associated lipoprotein